MSDAEKGDILRKVSELPPEQKLVALGFLQGLTAASADNRNTELTASGETDRGDHHGDNL